MAPSDHAMPRARGVPACRGVPWSIVVLAVVVLLQEAFGHLGPATACPRRVWPGARPGESSRALMRLIEAVRRHGSRARAPAWEQMGSAAIRPLTRFEGGQRDRWFMATTSFGPPIFLSLH